MMILNTSKEYLLTEKIKQGKAEIPKKYISLANWISNEFNVTVLNITSKKDRREKVDLEIIFELKKEEQKFKDRNGYPNSKKQEQISAKYKEIMRNDIDYSNAEYWVMFSSFEPLAKTEVINNIPSDKIDEFKDKYADKNIWTIIKFGYYITIFLNKEDQVKEVVNNGFKEVFEKELFYLAKQYDEFNYLKRETFSIYLDSKENFDTNYQSNWWYYYK